MRAEAHSTSCCLYLELIKQQFLHIAASQSWIQGQLIFQGRRINFRNKLWWTDIIFAIYHNPFPFFLVFSLHARVFDQTKSFRGQMRISVFYYFWRSSYKTEKWYDRFFMVYENHGVLIRFVFFFVCFKKGFVYSQTAYPRFTKGPRKEEGSSQPRMLTADPAAIPKLNQNLGTDHCSTSKCQISY